MADLEDYPSDSSDDDYVPGADSGDEEVSDVEEKDDESGGESGEEQVKCKKSKKSNKRKLKAANFSAHKRKGGIKLEGESEELAKDCSIAEEETSEDPCSEQKENANSEKEKERGDALWADFMKDMDVKPKEKPTVPSTSNGSIAQGPRLDKPNKVTVTKVYEFAGEEIRVTEQVDANSKEAKESEIQEIPEVKSEPALPIPAIQSNAAVTAKRPAGLSSVLNKISGKKKLSTLDKSLLDWKDFKVKEGINEELTTFNKGKDGYLEKQAFLQRADQRQFEVEKNVRLANRSTR